MKRLIFLCILFLLMIAISVQSGPPVVPGFLKQGGRLDGKFGDTLLIMKSATDTFLFLTPTSDGYGMTWDAARNSGSGMFISTSLPGAGGGESNTLIDTGTFDGVSGFGLSQTKAGTELRIRGLIEGSNVTIAASGDTGWTITVPAPGEVNTAGDTGWFDHFTGFGLTHSKVGAELKFVGLVQGNGITLSASSDTAIEIATSGDFFWTLANDSSGIAYVNDSTTDTLMNIKDSGIWTILNTENQGFWFSDIVYSTTYAGISKNVQIGGTTDTILMAGPRIYLGDRTKTDSLAASHRFVRVEAGDSARVAAGDSILNLDSSNITAGGIVTSDLEDSTVTGVKLSTVVWDSIRVGYTGGTTIWTQQDGNDSLRLIQKNGTDSLIYFDADTTNDTVTMKSDYVLKIQGGGTGTPVIDFSLATDLDSTRWDSILTDIRNPGSGSTDSFYVAESTTTTAGWKQSGDTVFVDTSSGGGSFDSTRYLHSEVLDTINANLDMGGNNIINVDTVGDAGLTVTDSIRINDRLYIIFGTDTVALPRTTGTLGQVMKLDPTADTMYWANDSVGAGGSGTTDSTRLGNGLAIRTLAQDSLAAPTDTIEADTSVLATINALIDSTAGKLDQDDANVDTTSWNLAYAIANALDTFSRLPMSRVYFDTTTGVNPDSLIVKYSDSSDIAKFNTDDLTEGSSNLYDQALPDSANWSTAFGWGDHSVAGYLTGNQTITLSGDVAGSGATAITTTIGVSKVDSNMLNSTEVDEYIQDKVGAMMIGTETGISVTYVDATADLDFVVAVDSTVVAADALSRSDMNWGTEVVKCYGPATARHTTTASNYLYSPFILGYDRWLLRDSTSLSGSTDYDTAAVHIPMSVAGTIDSIQIRYKTSVSEPDTSAIKWLALVEDGTITDSVTADLSNTSETTYSWSVSEAVAATNDMYIFFAFAFNEGTASGSTQYADIKWVHVFWTPD